MRRASIALLLMATLGGCDSGNVVTGGKEEKVTAVPMGDIDSAEGTISDEMINTDESTDEAPLDNSPVASTTAPKKADTAVKKTDAAKPAKPAETAAPPAPAPVEDGTGE